MYELPEPEIYTDERKAELLFNNAMTKEGWDDVASDVRSWGLDPEKIPFVDPTDRDQLPTRAEMHESIKRARAELGVLRSA